MQFYTFVHLFNYEQLNQELNNYAVGLSKKVSFLSFFNFQLCNSVVFEQKF